jgi:hypothetical protein
MTRDKIPVQRRKVEKITDAGPDKERASNAPEAEQRQQKSGCANDDLEPHGPLIGLLEWERRANLI